MKPSKNKPPAKPRGPSRPASLTEILDEVTGRKPFFWPRSGQPPLLIEYQPLSDEDEERITVLARRAVPPLKARPPIVPGLADDEQPRDEVYDMKDPEFLENSLKYQAEARALALYIAVPVIREAVATVVTEGGEPDPALLRKVLGAPKDKGGLGFTDPFLEALYRAVQGVQIPAEQEVRLAGFSYPSASTKS